MICICKRIVLEGAGEGRREGKVKGYILCQNTQLSVHWVLRVLDHVLVKLCSERRPRGKSTFFTLMMGNWTVTLSSGCVTSIKGLDSGFALVLEADIQ